MAFLGTRMSSINQYAQWIGMALVIIAGFGGGLKWGDREVPVIGPWRSVCLVIIGAIFAVLGSLKLIPELTNDPDRSGPALMPTSTSAEQSDKPAPSTHPAAIAKSATSRDAMSHATQAPAPVSSLDTAAAESTKWPSNDWTRALALKPGETVPVPAPRPLSWTDTAIGPELRYKAFIAGAEWWVVERTINSVVTAAYISRNVGAWTFDKRYSKSSGDQRSVVQSRCKGDELQAFKRRLNVEFGDPIDSLSKLGIDRAAKLSPRDRCDNADGRCQSTRTEDIDATVYDVGPDRRMIFQSGLQIVNKLVIYPEEPSTDVGYTEQWCIWELQFERV